MMKNSISRFLIFIPLLIIFSAKNSDAQSAARDVKNNEARNYPQDTRLITNVTTKQVIKSLYMPLADHYAAIIAYERYRHTFQYADFKIEQMSSWDLLRAYFQEGEVDMAFVMTPLALSMFHDNPHFKWVGLMHRDGNALAVNRILAEGLTLPAERSERLPNQALAALIKSHSMRLGSPVEINVPHIQSTHVAVLYRYLQEHGLSLMTQPHKGGDVLAVATAPARSPSVINGWANRAMPAALVQSLPWTEIVDTQDVGKVAWYSKDVMPWPKGHVECIMLATNKALINKELALAEVIKAIKQAGQDIERARGQGAKELNDLVAMIRKHIPRHTEKVIKAGLDGHLQAINYNDLNVDKAGLKLIMLYALEAGILQEEVDLDVFADQRFDSTDGSKSSGNASLPLKSFPGGVE